MALTGLSRACDNLNEYMREDCPTTGQPAEANEDKCQLLHVAFFPTPVGSDPDYMDYNSPPLKFKLTPITDTQIHRAIAKLGP